MIVASFELFVAVQSTARDDPRGFGGVCLRSAAIEGEGACHQSLSWVLDSTGSGLGRTAACVVNVELCSRGHRKANLSNLAPR